MSTALTILDRVQAQLAAVTTVDEAKKMRDEVAALEYYAKRSKQGLRTQNAVARVRLQVERRAGEVLLQVPTAQGKRDGSDGLLTTLKRSGITVDQCYKWKALARVAERDLLAFAARCDAESLELTATLVYDALVRWDVPAANTDYHQLPPEVLKRDLIRWGLLTADDLADLSPELELAVLLAVRGFYEDYCEDPARGKLTQDDGWNPCITVDRVRVRFNTRQALKRLRAGDIQTGPALRRALCGFYDDAQRDWERREGGQASAKRSSYRAPIVFTQKPSGPVGKWMVPAGRLLKETERMLDDDNETDLRESADLVRQVVGHVREALQQLEAALAGSE